METIVKQAREVGTSAGVLLPRKWLNKQVVVTLFSPPKEDIAKEVLEILIRKGLNEEVKGIYLYGSYARGDYGSESDIDVLVITSGINKLINHENYEILLVSERKLAERVKTELYYRAMIDEIELILNKELIEEYKKISSRKLNVEKLLGEIRKIIKINMETIGLCRDNNKKIPDGIVYSIVLRLRELYLIKCLKSGKKYSRDDFLKIAGEKNYYAYNRIKRNERDLENVSYDEVNGLLELSEKWLKELKG